MALIGGETAQMSDVYAPGEYDLAGTIVGVVDEDRILDGRAIVPGDVLVGLPSSGLHTNGYTLARKVLLEQAGLSLSDTPQGFTEPLGDALLAPHRSYLPEFIKAKDKVQIKGIAHITGGGFKGNIPRILPDQCQAVIDTAAWTPPALFELIREKGNIDTDEMYQVFNMGIGIIFMVNEADAGILKTLWPDAVVIGTIQTGSGVSLKI